VPPCHESATSFSFTRTPSSSIKKIPHSASQESCPTSSQTRPSCPLSTDLPPSPLLSHRRDFFTTLEHGRFNVPLYICPGHDHCSPHLRPLCNIRSSKRNTLLHALSTRLILSPLSSLSFRTPRIIVLSRFILPQSVVHYWFACKLQ
jgi:hypothetical protein